MMENYAALSLETHLFFARIMKEHSLFLEAGFPCADQDWIRRADFFRKEFEDLLRDTVRISNGNVNPSVLKSGELTTEFTIPAENRTQCLTGVEIDSRITQETQKLSSGCRKETRESLSEIHNLNRRAIRNLNGLIEFKENILSEVSNGNLFTGNYPLLIRHILREAKLYRSTVEELMGGRRPSYNNMRQNEDFWNRIMMEHALFMRGLLDPSECKLIETSDQYAIDYQKLLEESHCREQWAVNCSLTRESLEETVKFREFKTAGAKGILKCEISSIILPLLADHVLREANHYIRLLETN